jgi:hypothetical protein
MAIRIISLFCGALFGVEALLWRFAFSSEIWWSIIGLSAVVMGVLTAVFGRKFWETAVGLWHSDSTGMRYKGALHWSAWT